LSAPTKSKIDNIETYSPDFKAAQEFFTSFEPDVSEDKLLLNLKTRDVEPSKQSYTKYKVEFNWDGKQELEIEGEKHDRKYSAEICMRILLVQEKKYCIQFTKVKGNAREFHLAV